MTQFSEQLPADDMDAEIRFRSSVRYVMLDQIAELRELKGQEQFPWASFVLRHSVFSYLDMLNGLAGEW
ncbi:hypothetical protein [Burkholderia mayonis]|uniref:Uncharacterized protein n=1 Tax=Burkholderia mayonis TaxID=1385591 RepID=A0A1B4G6Y7_9BURK|nr:hypothetical protein [Burkholderia mayonis]AOJ11693.1 hypothetical protein WS71_32160 [Burkholderia mayonis]KVE54597.1 hypothetical protein WS71_04015 [Burkholderia mayonis]